MQDEERIKVALDELLSSELRLRPGSGSHGYTHPLQTLLARDLISPGLYYGGHRFRADCELGFITGTGTMNWQRPVTCRAHSYNKQARDESAANNTIAHIANMLRPVDFRIVVAVCAHGHTLRDIAEVARLAPKTVSKRFVAALEQVADYYTRLIEQRSGD